MKPTIQGKVILDETSDSHEYYCTQMFKDGGYVLSVHGWTDTYTKNLIKGHVEELHDITIHTICGYCL